MINDFPTNTEKIVEFLTPKSILGIIKRHN